MSIRTLLSSKVAIVSCLIVFGGILPTAASAATSTAVDIYVANIRDYLQEKKIWLEKDIANLQVWEASTTQTVTGQRINEAVGDDMFVPKTRPTGTVSQTTVRLAEQVLLFFIIVGLYILAHPLLLYIVLAFLVFVLVRLLWRMIGRQQF